MECFDIFFERVLNTKQYDIKLYISSKKKIDNDVISFIAPNPPDYITSFSGSALPFANKEQAFENTKNKGTLTLDSNNNDSTVIYLKFPNSYYIHLGNILVVPHVDIIFNIDKIEHIFSYKLSDNPIRYRSLTHPCTRTSPVFYATETDKPVIMSQAELLIANGYLSCPLSSSSSSSSFLNPQR